MPKFFIARCLERKGKSNQKGGVTMRRKSSLTVVAAAVIMASMLVFGDISASSGAATTGEVLKIGLIHSLSGPFGMLTKYSMPVIQMEFDKVNASGGLLGKQVQLVIRDDQGDPSVVAQKLTELKGEGCSAILGPFMGANGRPAMQWAAANKMTLVTYASPSLSDRVDHPKYVFFTTPVQVATAEAMYRGLLARPFKSFYYIGADIANAHELYDYVSAKMKKEHPEIANLGDVWVGLNTMEFSNLISTTLAKNPDVLISGSAGPGWAAFAQQGMKFNLFKKMRVAATYALESAVTTSFGKNYPEGVETTSWAPFWDKSKAMQEFTQASLKVSKVYPADKGMECYLGTLALIAGVRKAGSVDPDTLSTVMENLSFDTPLGTLHFNDYDHQLKIPIWWSTTGYSKDYPIAIGVKNIKYGDDLYPSKEEILRLRAAQK
jgi:branched-chain amino acid transport system substrate-binding protein